jgi:hypothetical protein
MRISPGPQRVKYVDLNDNMRTKKILNATKVIFMRPKKIVAIVFQTAT